MKRPEQIVITRKGGDLYKVATMDQKGIINTYEAERDVVCRCIDEEMQEMLETAKLGSEACDGNQ